MTSPRDFWPVTPDRIGAFERPDSSDLTSDEVLQKGPPIVGSGCVTYTTEEGQEWVGEVSTLDLGPRLRTMVLVVTSAPAFVSEVPVLLGRNEGSQDGVLTCLYDEARRVLKQVAENPRARAQRAYLEARAERDRIVEARRRMYQVADDLAPCIARAAAEMETHLRTFFGLPPAEGTPRADPQGTTCPIDT